MISNKLKTLFGIALLLIAAHGVEENLTGFLYKDSFVNYFSNLYATKEEVFYWAFHIMWWLMLIVVYLLIRGGRWILYLLSLFSIVFAFESHHVIKGILSGGYYPGMITGFFYPVLGIFFWKELLGVYKR